MGEIIPFPPRKKKSPDPKSDDTIATILEQLATEIFNVTLLGEQIEQTIKDTAPSDLNPDPDGAA